MLNIVYVSSKTETSWIVAGGLQLWNKGSFRGTKGGCSGETPETRQNVATIASR